VSPHGLRHTWAAVQQTGRPTASFWSDATRSPSAPWRSWRRPSRSGTWTGSV